MRRLCLVAAILLPLVACTSEHKTTVVATPGSTVIAPGDAKVVTPGQ
jgi:hypothetical protein